MRETFTKEMALTAPQPLGSRTIGSLAIPQSRKSLGHREHARFGSLGQRKVDLRFCSHSTSARCQQTPRDLLAHRAITRLLRLATLAAFLLFARGGKRARDVGFGSVSVEPLDVADVWNQVGSRHGGMDFMGFDPGWAGRGRTQPSPPGRNQTTVQTVALLARISRSTRQRFEMDAVLA